MKAKTKTVLSVIINTVICLATTATVISYFFIKSPLIENGWESFKFFTTDSNVLTAIAAALTAAYNIAVLRGKRGALPRAVTFFKFMGAVSLTLVFLTVMCLLLPAYGAETVFGGTGFYMHVITPVLSVLSFAWLDGHRRIPLKQAWLGMPAIVAYGALYLTQVVILQNWSDFYLFNYGGRWYITLPVILSVSYGLSVLLSVLLNQLQRRNS